MDETTNTSDAVETTAEPTQADPNIIKVGDTTFAYHPTEDSVEILNRSRCVVPRSDLLEWVEQFHARGLTKAASAGGEGGGRTGVMSASDLMRDPGTTETFGNTQADDRSE